MKSLKFTPKLIEQILSGTKTSTIRLFDDKDLQIGDEVRLINKDNSQEVGLARITQLNQKRLCDLVDSDFEGNGKFESDEQMYNTFRKYYGDRVIPETMAKIITFERIVN